MRSAQSSFDHAVVHLPTHDLSIVEVVFDVRSAGLEATYTYANPQGCEVGDLVLAPLGPRTTVGLVVESRSVAPEDLGFAPSRLRPVSGVIAGVRLPGYLVRLLKHAAGVTLSDLSAVVGLALPPGLKDRLVTRWVAARAGELGAPTSNAAEQEVLRILSATDGEIRETKTKPVNPKIKKFLRERVRGGWIRELTEVEIHAERSRIGGEVRLTSDDSKIERFLQKEGRKKPAQAMALMRLQGMSDSVLTGAEIKALSGVTDQTILGLISAGLLEKVEGEAPALHPAPAPNPGQAKAAEAIIEAIRHPEGQQFLLYGVTGSGKTEVYLRAAEAALREGRRVLFLVPEIALTAQVVGQLKGRFGRGVAVLHSNLSAQERLANWLRIARGEAAVILGARSALFAPISNLGLIVVDEEHEGSYKQESAPRYQARELALELSRLTQAPIVLGSATPSIESMWRAKVGTFRLLELTHRAAAAKMPTVHIEDLTEFYKTGKAVMFTPILLEKVRAAIQRGEQAIFFLNRRAFSPFLMCRECGKKYACPKCAVTLSYHKKLARLRCHHCGHEEPAPDLCTDCGGTKVLPFGAGVERVEEAVALEFPEAVVARLDRDVVQRKGALEEILARFRSGEIQILVGTQMVAKGLDFPNVTVVGVIAADLSLNIPDFRAGERTFQLLSQVAGRAGRGQRLGEVVIQTLSPTHPAILHAAEHAYLPFYDSVLAERQIALYPPFCHLINWVISGENRPKVRETARMLSEAIRFMDPSLTVLGPVDCPLERLNNQWREHVLVKVDDPAKIPPLAALARIDLDPGISLSVDVDPYSMM